MLYLRKNINICLNKSNLNSKIGIYNKKNLIFLILKRNELFFRKGRILYILEGSYS